MFFRRVSCAIALSLVMLTGCAVRPTESIRSDGDFAFSRRDYAAAASYYEQIVDRHPGDWQAQYRLGICLTELGRPAEGRLALEQALSLRPGDEDVADALAEAMHRQGAVDELFAFLRGRADVTRTAKAHLDLARYAMEHDDLDTASVALLTAIEVDGGRSTNPYLARAEWAERVGNTNEAVRRLRQAYGINPHDPRVLAGLRTYGETPGPTLALPPGR